MCKKASAYEVGTLPVVPFYLPSMSSPLQAIMLLAQYRLDTLGVEVVGLGAGRPGGAGRAAAVVGASALAPIGRVMSAISSFEA
jgi:hypothetical protein